MNLSLFIPSRPFFRCNVYVSFIKKIIKNETFIPGTINIIFVNPRFILHINKKYLFHNYVTDIITFDFSQNKIISGDLYICREKILLNSKEYNTSYKDELNRVIIHGVLHLLKYDDKTMKQRALMREKENYYLNLFLSSNGK